MKSLDSLNVLLIEDNPSDALLLSTALEGDPFSRFNLTSVERLAEGLQYLAGGRFDIVLADLGLPDSTGLETFEQLHKQSPDTPIIVFSGNEDEEQAIHAVRDGAQDYLVKSLSGFDMTARSIRHAIERNKLQTTLRESEERHRLISELASDYVYSGSVSVEGKSETNWISGAFERITGYTRDEINTLSDGFSTLIVPEDLKQIIDGQAEFLQTRARTSEYRIHRKDGEIRWLRDRMQILDAVPNPHGFTIIGAVQDITERKQAEDALKESEELLRLAYESADLGVWKNDLETGMVYFDERARLHYGFDRHEVTIGDVTNRIHPDDVARVGSEIAAATSPTANGKFATEYRVIHPDGSVHWLYVGVRVTFAEAGEQRRPVMGYGTSIDITERKQAEEALRESEERFAKAFFTSPVSQSIITLGTNEIIEVNDACCQLFGYGREELIGAVTSKLNLWANPADRRSAVEELQKTGHLQAREVTIHRKTGELYTGIAAIEPISWKGAPCLITFVFDISEWKRVEAQLRKSEEQYRYLFENNPHPMWAYDLTTLQFLAVNESALEKYGYTRDEFLAMTIADIRPPEDLERLRENLNRPRLALEHSGAWRHKLKNGNIIDVEISSHALDLAGHSAALVVALDITERRKAEEALQQSEERYQQFISQSFEAISRIEFDQPVDTSLPIEEQIEQIYANAYMAESNQAMADMYHIPLDKFIGLRLIDVHGGKADPINREVFRKLIQKDYRSIDDETIESDSQGNQRWFLSNTIGTVENGKLVRLWGTAIEITDRKKAEAAVHESNERFRQIAENIREVFWMYDNQIQNLLYVSPAYEVIWGRPIQDAFESAQNYVDFVLPEDRPRVLAVDEQQMRGEITDLEYRIVRPNGSICWIHERSFPVLNEDGQLIRTTGIATDITDRKQAEQDAVYRQELLEKVIQLGKDIAILTDLEKCLWEIYKSARFGLGFDRVGLFLYDASVEHVLGVYGTSRTGEIDEPGFFDGPLLKFGSWERALQSPTGVSWLDDYQTHFDVPEGDTMYGVRQHVVVAGWAGEKPVALITVDNLISGRTIKPAEVEALQLFAGYAGLAIENASLHAELELKVEERTAEVQDLYDNAPTGYHSVDTNGCLIQINQTELSWLGYTKEEMLGQPVTEFITEESGLIFQESFLHFKQNSVLRDLELEMVRKDGSTFPVLINATVVRDGSGNYVSSRFTVFDNTEHKLAEDAVRQSEETYRALFQNANDGIFIFGLDRSIQRANPKGAEMLGYPAEELVGRYDTEFLEPEHAADSARRAEELIEGKHIPVYERKLLRKDGTWIETEINLSLISDASENPRYIQSVIRDISTRKRAEETLRLANIELERALRLKDEFLASMSHELRTPLTGILGLSEALQYDTYGELSPKQKKVISNIESNGHHLLDLINDILDISKMEAGKLELEMVPCSLDDICQSSLQLVKGMAQKKGQHVSFSMNAAGISVKGDVRRLKQIVVNLLSNAVKYSPEGKRVGLDIIADPSTQAVRVEIWDQGIGIALEDMNRLFKPFVQLDSSLSRQQSGTGLGLALVQRLVDLHGGSIQVESVPGQGSRFSVRLPYLPDTSEPQEQRHGEGFSQIQRSLIVEDNDVDANRLTRFLKQLGVQAIVETRGEGVVQKAIASQPAVILLDLNLPDTSGWDVLEKLKQNPKTSTIPVVITSVVEERERANRLGAAGYLLKLFTLDELRLILSRIPKPVDARNDRALVIAPNAASDVIMIVDDNETNVLMLEDFLHSRNYQVFSSHSGFDFLARVPEIQPDMILMDIQMPDMDGLETIRRLRVLPDPELSATPVVAITALAMPGDRERCLEAGADEYISKPIRLKDLDALIQKILTDKDNVDRLASSNTDPDEPLQ